MKKGTGLGGSWLQLSGITANVPFGIPSTVKPCLLHGGRERTEWTKLNAQSEKGSEPKTPVQNLGVIHKLAMPM